MGCDVGNWIDVAQDSDQRRAYVKKASLKPVNNNNNNNNSVLPKGRSFSAISAFSTLPSTQPSFSYLHGVHLS